MLDVENRLLAWRSLHDGLCAAQSELRKVRSCNAGARDRVAQLEAKVWDLQCKSDEALAALNAEFSKHQQARYAAKVASGKQLSLTAD
jgi:hypothetical protein